MEVDPKKVENMQKWFMLRDLRELKGIFRFDRVLSEVCQELRENHSPLMSLLKKNAFKWSKEAQ